MKGRLPILGRLAHEFSRRIPVRWRMYLLAFRGRSTSARGHDVWQESTDLYPAPWPKPLVVVSGTQDHRDLSAFLDRLRQDGWPVALVWPHRNAWWGRILGMRAPVESSHKPVKPWGGSKVLPAVAIPKAAVAPLGVVIGIQGERAAGDLVSQLGYSSIFMAANEPVLDGISALSARLASAFPRVSVLLAVYNQKRTTEICLESLYAFTDYPNWEIVAVDNASDDGTDLLLARWAQEKPNFRLIKNATNLGFPAACNQAARAASGEILCVLNNDTVVTPGWLSSLVDELLRHPEVGLVGPVSNGVANEARVRAPFRTPEELPLWAMARQRRYFRQARKMSVLALFCAATWRKVWEEMGGLDEDFGVGLFEDDDFCFRLREAGFQLRCRLDAYVHHFQGSSFGQLQSQEYLELYERNRKLFWAKLRQRRRRA